jgi:hypothetical protein
MSDKINLYPVSKVIAKIIMNSGYTPFGFILAMGHSGAEAGLPDLESWLEKGEGDQSTIAQIAAFDPDDAEKLHKAVAETAAMKAAGVDPASLERARIEREHALFKPYIRAQGENSVPSGITMFGLSGGHERWHTIHIPAAIVKLPLEEQLAKVPELMAEYRQQYVGMCPFFGKLTGFKFVRRIDYFRFDADGRFLEHVVEPVRRSVAWVELR